MGDKLEEKQEIPVLHVINIYYIIYYMQAKNIILKMCL